MHLDHPTTYHHFLQKHNNNNNNMASEQLARRENTTTEREVHVEKDRVPRMATHFEHLADQTKESDITAGKDTPKGSIESLQGGEQLRDHAGKAIGDVGGRAEARDTHELGAHFESLADKVKPSTESDHAVGNKETQVGMFQGGDHRGNKDTQQLQTQTREIASTRGSSHLSSERSPTKVIERTDKGRGVERARDEEENVVRGRVGAENEGARTTAVITCTLEHGDNTSQKPREDSESTERSTLDQATQSVKEKLNTTAQTATQAKDTTLEKGQKGYAATKDTISSAAKAASEKTVPVAEKAKEYTLEAAEKAKSAGGTTAGYVGEKAVQAKDVTVEGGKSAAEYAAKVAADLKDKAAAVGWAAAHFSTEKTVEGTKAAAHVVEGAAGYAGHKAAELASKSAGAVKGLAASAGETVKEYTARKKQEAQRELEGKRASRPQEAESQGIGETVIQYAQKLKPSGGGSKQEGTGSNVFTAKGGGGNEEEQKKGVIGETLTSIGEKLKDAKQREELLDNVTGNITEGGGKVLGAVGETMAEIGENTMKPAEIVQERGAQQEGGAGVLDAIGETIAGIAETTRVMVAGDEESQTLVPDTQVTHRAKHQQGSQSA